MITVHPDRIDCTTPAEVGWLRRHRCSLPAMLVAPKPANPHREMLRPGKVVKRCRKCRAEFRVEDRSDCRAVNCKACRTSRRPRKPTHRVICAKVGCRDTFETSREGVRYCRAHRNAHHPVVVPRPPLPPVYVRPTVCRCGLPLDSRGRCAECEGIGVWA